VDLLDQAAELLQYQFDHRLQGAARAQVAARLAVVYLMNHKADRALSTLRASRVGDLANELRTQRLLLEARALSDLGCYDLALEVAGNLEGRKTTRLRSDIMWAVSRWAQPSPRLMLISCAASGVTETIRAATEAASVCTRTRRPQGNVIRSCLPDGPTNSPSPVRESRRALCLL
jgi:hypothetical protein